VPAKQRRLRSLICLQKVIVDEVSATLDGFGKLGLASDHFRMNRYGSPEDSNYRCVKNEILRIAGVAMSHHSKMANGP
jgi:hypothetical protein